MLGNLILLCSAAQGAFDAYAMGNYPFASDYMTGAPGHNLPAWPMREACRFMTLPPSSNTKYSRTNHRPARKQPPTATATISVISSGDIAEESDAFAPARRLLSEPAAQAAGGSHAEVDLIANLCKAAAMLYNVTGDQSCFKLDLSGPAAGSAGKGKLLSSVWIAYGLHTHFTCLLNCWKQPWNFEIIPCEHQLC